MKLRLGSVIELNRTPPKILPIEHNRTFGNRTLIKIKKSNIIEHWMQQSNIKPVSSGFKQKALRSKKLCIGFNFKHKYAKMSQRAENGNNSGNDVYRLQQRQKSLFLSSFLLKNKIR